MKLESFISTPWLLDAGIRSFVLVALVLAVLLLLRRAAASTRHFVLLLTLGSLLILPFIQYSLPGLRVLPRLARVSPANSQNATTDVTRPNDPAPGASLAQKGELWTDATTAKVDPTPIPEQANRFLKWIPSVWLIGVGCAFLPVVLGWLSLFRLKRKAVKVTNEAQVALLKQLASRLGIKREVFLLEHSDRRMPMTWGFRPVILLPSGSASWPESRLRCALQHELAHVRRFDFQTRLLAHAIRALYWFNPLVWYATARLVREQELACDDLVLQSGTRAVEYAECMVNLASGLAGAGMLRSSAVAMAEPSKLEHRIRSILDEERNRSSVSRKGGTLIIAAFMSFVPFLGVLKPADARSTARTGVRGEGVLTAGNQDAKAPAGLPHAPSATLERSFVRIVAGESGLTFQGKRTTWDALPELLEKVPDRPHTVLEFAIDTDEITLRRLNEEQARGKALAEKFGFQYFSYMGVHPRPNGAVDSKTAEKVKLRVIVLGSPSGEATEDKKRLAFEIQGRLEKGASFAEMAELYSNGSQRTEGGDWGWIDPAKLLKGLSDVISVLKKGQRSEVIGLATENGIYWIHTYDRAGRETLIRKYNENGVILGKGEAAASGLTPPAPSAFYLLFVEDRTQNPKINASAVPPANQEITNSSGRPPNSGEGVFLEYIRELKIQLENPLLDSEKRSELTALVREREASLGRFRLRLKELEARADRASLEQKALYERDRGRRAVAALNFRDGLSSLKAGHTNVIADHGTNPLLWQVVEQAHDKGTVAEIAKAENDLAAYLTKKLERIDHKAYPKDLSLQKVLEYYQNHPLSK
jgi:beta-lactamase regulating signal transducer with metallopeptidase domain